MTPAANAILYGLLQCHAVTTSTTAIGESLDLLRRNSHAALFEDTSQVFRLHGLHKGRNHVCCGWVAEMLLHLVHHLWCHLRPASRHLPYTSNQ